MTGKHSGMRRKIGLFGGTFDPVHNGHLRMALEAGEELALEQVRLLPCHRPPHRETPNVDSDQRTHMLRLAVESCPLLKLDDRELRRDGPSYTLETLQSLRAELGPEVSLIWVMGSDSFLGLESWHRWRELLDYAHLLVVARPGWELPQEGALHDWLLNHRAPTKSGGDPGGLGTGALVAPAAHFGHGNTADHRRRPVPPVFTARISLAVCSKTPALPSLRRRPGR